MKVVIKKSVDVIVEIPDDKVKDYFGENLNESQFINWAANDMYLSCPGEYDEDDKLGVESWLSGETTHFIEIENCPKELKSKYSQDEIDEINEERERIEHCYECEGYGDDYSYDDESGELVSNCENCPFNGH